MVNDVEPNNFKGPSGLQALTSDLVGCPALNKGVPARIPEANFLITDQPPSADCRYAPRNIRHSPVDAATGCVPARAQKTYPTFFRLLGQRVREIRRQRDLTQEDMISFGFSARHWHQIEAGRPITVNTLLHVCEALEVSPVELIRGLPIKRHTKP